MRRLDSSKWNHFLHRPCYDNIFDNDPEIQVPQFITSTQKIQEPAKYIDTVFSVLVRCFMFWGSGNAFEMLLEFYRDAYHEVSVGPAEWILYDFGSSYRCHVKH